MWETIVKGWKAYWGWMKRRKEKRLARRRAKGPVRDWLEFILTLTIMVFFIRTTVVEAYRIPSSSMEDTLLISDFLMVNSEAIWDKSPSARCGNIRIRLNHHSRRDAERRILI